MARMCTRIWCVRPVSRRHSSSVASAKRPRTRTGAGRLAARGHRHARARARVAPDRRVDLAAARRRRPCTSARYARLTVRSASWRTRRSAPRGSSRPPADRWCPCPADARCPARGTRRARAHGAAARSASVPSRLPAPGCTTRPAGLSMTTIASSSCTISSAMRLGRGARRRARARPRRARRARRRTTLRLLRCAPAVHA